MYTPNLELAYSICLSLLMLELKIPLPDDDWAVEEAGSYLLLVLKPFVKSDLSVVSDYQDHR